MRRLGSHFYLRLACGSLPEVKREVILTDMLDYKWYSVSYGTLSLGKIPVIIGCDNRP